RVTARAGGALGAPGPDGTIGLERERVAESCRHRFYSGQSGYRYRHRLIGVAAVSEFAVAVVSPGPYAAIGLQRDRVTEAAGGNRGDAAQAARLNRERTVGGNADAQLAQAVVAPHRNAAVGFQRHRMVTAVRDRRRAGEPAHRYRRQPAHRRSVADFGDLIVA